MAGQLASDFRCYIMENSSGRLYRIMNFHHVVQLFERRELFFAHPSSWQDPYETRLTYRENHKIYAQCWCGKGVSDAMWRIYSPNHLGIRISTSTRKLRQALEKSKKNADFDIRLGEVDYLSQFNINKSAKALHAELANSFDISRAIDFLYMKREAFSHEAEYRVVLINHAAEADQITKGFKVSINPMQLIDSILIDPRAPDELAAALSFYFTEKIGFKKRVQRSVLYKAPGLLVVEQ